MSIETLAAVAGVLGTLVAVAALVWQISVHRNSGRKVRVDSSYIIPLYENPDFEGDDFIQIEVKNTGEKPVTVTNYAVELGNRGSGRNLWVTRPPVWATRLPAVVVPGGVPIKVVVPVLELEKVRHASGVPFDKMHPWVELGDGRKAYSTNAVPIKD